MTSFERRLRRQKRLTERATLLSLAFEERAHEMLARARYSRTMRLRDALWIVWTRSQLELVWKREARLSKKTGMTAVRHDDGRVAFQPGYSGDMSDDD